MLCLRKSLSVDPTATFLRTAQPRDTASSTQAALKPHLGFDPSHVSDKLKSTQYRQTTRSLSPTKAKTLKPQKCAQPRPEKTSKLVITNIPRKLSYAPNQPNPNPPKNHQTTRRPKQEKNNIAQRLVHQIRPTQRTFLTSTTFPPPVNPPALQRGRIWVTRIVVLKKISERRRHRNLPANNTAPRHCLINPSCSQTSPRIRPI